MVMEIDVKWKAILVTSLLLTIGFQTSWAQQKFDRSIFYKVMASGDTGAINKEINIIAKSSLSNKEGYDGALLMKKAGLITKTRDAQWRRCKVNGEGLKDATEWMEEFRVFWDATPRLFEAKRRQKFEAAVTWRDLTGREYVARYRHDLEVFRELPESLSPFRPLPPGVGYPPPST